ncbi:hypothetical protein [Frankia sp. AgW1.1]|uniref:hypothetical protein n=1 Tax=Frankia sp. AgW1.1 TaxID=1836971 RepID=UPI0019317425|nr:hypothetical protein [Frankia sp. AgW1.1]
MRNDPPSHHSGRLAANDPSADRHAPAWNLTALANPKVIHIPDESTAPRDRAATLAAAALAAQLAGDPAAPALIRRLATAGVVAITVGRRRYVCRETVASWVLLPTHRRVATRDLANAAADRAHRLAALRLRLPGHPDRPETPDHDPEPEPARPRRSGPNHRPRQRGRCPTRFEPVG